MEVGANDLLYVTGGEAIAVYDTSMRKVGEIHVGPYQFDQSRQMTISADGTRAYVTGHVVVVEDANAGYFNGENIITDSHDNLWRVVGEYDAVSVIDISNPSSPTYNTESRVSPLLGPRRTVQSIPMVAGFMSPLQTGRGSR